MLCSGWWWVQRESYLKLPSGAALTANPHGDSREVGETAGDVSSQTLRYEKTHCPCSFLLAETAHVTHSL